MMEVRRLVRSFMAPRMEVVATVAEAEAEAMVAEVAMEADMAGGAVAIAIMVVVSVARKLNLYLNQSPK